MTHLWLAIGAGRVISKRVEGHPSVGYDLTGKGTESCESIGSLTRFPPLVWPRPFQAALDTWPEGEWCGCGVVRHQVRVYSKCMQKSYKLVGKGLITFKDAVDLQGFVNDFVDQGAKS